MMHGEEWVVDAYGCCGFALRDEERLRLVCLRIINGLGLRPVAEPLWHVFPGEGGMTGLFLLSESHLTFHTWPELGSAAFNLFTCRPRRRWPWNKELVAMLRAETVCVRRITRGVDDGESLENEKKRGGATTRRLVATRDGG